jgi:hypothetical protein
LGLFSGGPQIIPGRQSASLLHGPVAGFRGSTHFRSTRHTGLGKVGFEVSCASALSGSRAIANTIIDSRLTGFSLPGLFAICLTGDNRELAQLKGGGVKPAAIMSSICSELERLSGRHRAGLHGTPRLRDRAPPMGRHRPPNFSARRLCSAGAPQGLIEQSRDWLDHDAALLQIHRLDHVLDRGHQHLARAAADDHHVVGAG